MKKWLIIITLILISIRLSDRQSLNTESIKKLDIYYLYYQDANVTIWHPHNLKFKEYPQPITKVYEDLAEYYNRKGNDYVYTAA